jgi:predicted nucleotidyltransferase
MNFEEIKQQIKITVGQIIPNCEIILFGSFARGSNNKYSDIDLLLITSYEIAPREKLSIASKINKLLVQKLHKPFDVLINSKREVEIKKTLPGHVVRAAIREGLVL